MDSSQFAAADGTGAVPGNAETTASGQSGTTASGTTASGTPESRPANPGPTSLGYEAFGGEINTWMSESTSWWPGVPDATGAPNIVVMLVDDLGFSDLGAFGGEIPTPNIDRIARDGTRFSNYHSTPLCSPSRAALLTGLNPHRAGFGFVAHADPGFPAFRLEIAEDVPTLAHSLRGAGYATFAVGKWHLTKESNLHDGAPKTTWPLQRGFDRYYGSMDGFTTMFHPHRIVVDNSPEERQWGDDEYVTDTLTDRAVGMIRTLRNSDERRPFFLYFAQQAVHGPIQALPEDLEVVRGLYDDGWDAVRERRFERQQQLGVLPPGAALSPTPREGRAAVREWERLSADERAVAVRHMEIYAASVVALDRSVGRMIAELEASGEYDNTIFVITSDNGATAEGGGLGTRSYFSAFELGTDTGDDWDRDVDRGVDEIGGPRVHGHYPSGWAHVSNTPFREYKFTAFEGGVHCPLIVSWPGSDGRFGEGGEVRHQFAYVTDLLPTMLRAAGVERGDVAPGLAAPDLDGHDLGDVLESASVPSPHVEQYVECGGELAYFDDGWKAVAPRRTGQYDLESGWQLYRLADDPTETRDLAHEHPERLAEMIEAWRQTAWRNLVFPLDDDGSMRRVRPESERRLTEPLTVRPGTARLERFRSSRLTVGRPFTVSCRIETGGREGVVFAHGDQGGGYLVAIEGDGVLLSYNAYGRMSRARSPQLPPGEHDLTLHVEGAGAMRWSLRVEIDGATVASIERVPQLVGMAPFTGISVGVDAQGPVDWELRQQRGDDFRFDGIIGGVRWEPGAFFDENLVEYRSIEQRSAIRAD